MIKIPGIIGGSSILGLPGSDVAEVPGLSGTQSHGHGEGTAEDALATQELEFVRFAGDEPVDPEAAIVADLLLGAVLVEIGRAHV